jgi:predicted ArsR family transcriptional regulator
LQIRVGRDRAAGEAVRQQLVQLQGEGWIMPRKQAAGGKTGRPAATYVLTTAGDHLFPKEYDSLTVALIDAVSELGDESLDRVLGAIVEAKVARWKESLTTLTLEERVTALRDLYLDRDPFTHVEKNDEEYRLIERNCPFLNTAMARPLLCSVTVNVLRHLLGVEVVREERFQDGDGRCVFRVRTKQAAPESGFIREPHRAA